MARGALIAIAGAVLLGTLAVDAHGETLTVQTTVSLPLPLRGGYVRCVAVNGQEGLRRSLSSPSLASASSLPVGEAMGTEAESANEANSKGDNGIRVLGIRGQTCWYPNELKHKAPPSPSRQQNR